MNKMRYKPDESEVTHVIGEVEGKRAIMIDDVIATGGTLINAAERLVAEARRRFTRRPPTASSRGRPTAGSKTP